MTTSTPETKDVRLERTVAAPPELVWEMWTKAEHFQAWYGPTGASIPVANMDVTVGGSRLICMEMPTPDGPMQMWFTGEYLEIVPNKRLVYTESMCDPEGNILTPEQMGMPAGHPQTTQVIVELEPAAGGTKMALTHVGVPAGSPGEGGWTMALDKLEARLDAA